MKAFLSHSSQNKEFVRAVANELGRQFCIFDEQAFLSGIEFKRSIEQGFDDSCVFVLFASEYALKSIWVDLEIEEAWFRSLEKNLSKSLVYLISSSVHEQELPKWLQYAKAIRENSPQIIARDIKYHINELLRERRTDCWIWRTREAQELQNALWSTDGSISHTVFIHGFPGIGRRTFIKQTTPAFLRLNKHVELEIEEGLNINDICSIVSSLVEPSSTLEGTRRLVETIKSLSSSQAIERTLDNLRRMVRRNELPIFIDKGGLLNSEGIISEPIQSILKAITPNDEAYIFLVSWRRPFSNSFTSLPLIHVQALGEDDSKRLLLKLAEKSDLPLNATVLSELALYVAGYPPAADVAIQQVKRYGSSITLQRKEPARYRTEVFLKYLATIALNENEKRILRLFAMFSPIPFNVVGEALGITLENLDTILIRLIDLSLITVDYEGFYRIADPVAEAISKAFGSPKEKENRLLSEKLYSFLEETKLEVPQLELSRVLFKAASLAKDQKIKDRAVRLSSDLIKLTETLYHKQRYAEASACGFEAVRERPDSIKARSFLIRALIKEERYSDAEQEIQKFRQHHQQNLADSFFLLGFLNRNRSQISEAIAYYRDAERFGRKDIALLRELALCYFLKGNLDLADQYINRAREERDGNSYVIDLWAKIATYRRDEQEARRAIEQLKDINPLFYYHRLSCTEFAFGNLEEAQRAAEFAKGLEDSPPFEILAQLINCKLALGKENPLNLQQAELLINEIDNKFSRTRKDIRTTLKCRLQINLGHFREALNLSEKISNKGTYYYKKIRRDAINGELQVSALDDTVRQQYERELQLLNDELKNTEDDVFSVEFGILQVFDE